MGKPTGFIDYLRELPLDRPAIKRIQDWQEFHLHLEEAKLREQGARCMDCGIPFCHTGTLLSGMASGCPINNLIPEWNDLVYRGLWREALERLHKTNNFPEFTGRVCPAPCEGSCVLGINAPPVTIKNIECEIIDHGWEHGWVKPEPPKKRTGKTVAVIGSGPAGEKGAAQAAYFGKRVALIERSDYLGGAGINTGTVPSKTLRETALYFSGLRQRGLYGIDYSLKERLTIADLMRRQQDVVEMERAIVRTNMERHNVARRWVLAATQADQLDTGTLELGNRSLLTYALTQQKIPIQPLDLRQWLSEAEKQVPKLYQQFVKSESASTSADESDQEPTLFDFSRRKARPVQIQ